MLCAILPNCISPPTDVHFQLTGSGYCKGAHGRIIKHLLRSTESPNCNRQCCEHECAAVATCAGYAFKPTTSRGRDTCLLYGTNLTLSDMPKASKGWSLRIWGGGVLLSGAEPIVSGSGSSGVNCYKRLAGVCQCSPSGPEFARVHKLATFFPRSIAV